MSAQRCPRGCLNGYVYNPGIDKMCYCFLCRGAGKLDPEQMCACGKPAVCEKDGRRYCGTDACLIDVKRAERESEAQTSFGFGLGPY